MGWGLGLQVTGMVIAFVGAAVAAWGAFISQHRIDDLSGTYWDENPHQRTNLLVQRNATAIGLATVAAGTALQIVGTILSV